MQGKIQLQYYMNDCWVKSVDEERDLGMIMSKGLKQVSDVVLEGMTEDKIKSNYRKQ